MTLYVACDGYIISNSELFEFKVKDDPETKDSVPEWFSMTGKAGILTSDLSVSFCDIHTSHVSI